MLSRRLFIFSIACLFFVCGCVSKYSSTLDFNPQESLRVLVVPFYQVDKNGQVVEADPNLLIDDVSLVSSKLKETPAVFLQKIVQAELSKSALDVIPAALVNSELVHHGMANADLSPDPKKLIAAQPKEICSHLLYCDALLYGRVTKWQRDYYGIETVQIVGLELKLVAAKDGKVLFESKAEDSDSRGITKGPTGFSNLLIEPIKGLDNDIITTLSREMVRKLLAPLTSSGLEKSDKSPPPAIYASAHDALDGRIEKNGHLTVLVYGSPGKSASFSVGSSIEQVPMSERAPGHYIGEYYPLLTDSFSNMRVSVSLQDEHGRVTSQNLGNPAVSVN